MRALTRTAGICDLGASFRGGALVLASARAIEIASQFLQVDLLPTAPCGAGLHQIERIVMTKAKLKPTDDDAIHTDGRRQRSDANRRRIAEALIDLAIAGETSPSAERVAETAGVGRRTVFRLFSDMDGVYREAHALMIARLAPIIDEPIHGPTWRARLDQLVDRRVRLFEEILPIKSGSDARRGQSAFLQSGHEEFTRLLRGVLLFVAPKSVSEDRTLFEAVELTLSFESWRRLRQEQRLSAKMAGSVMRRMIAALLD